MPTALDRGRRSRPRIPPSARFSAVCIWFAAAILTVLVVPGCGNGGKTREAAEELPIRDDFQGECTWPQETSDTDSVSCTEGQYKVLITRANASSWIPRRTQEGPYQSVAVSADTTLLVPPGPDDLALQGVGCWASASGDATLGYVFGLYARGDGTRGYLIERQDETEGSDTLIQDETKSDLLPPVGSPAKMRGECHKSVSDDSVQLTLFIDGEKVAEEWDNYASAINGFVAFGFFVIASKPGTDFRYDNFVAEEITG
jgi:hypothetical protein